MELKDVVIVDALRTAFGKYNGSLTKLNPDEILAPVMVELLKRNNIPQEKLDISIMGNVDGHSTGPNLGRLALLRAGFPQNIPGFTVEHQCGSGLAAINVAYMYIATGVYDIVLAGGSENMSNMPYWIENARLGKDLQIHDQFMETARRVCGPELAKLNYNMGLTAENVAAKYNISREEQDAYAYRSQMLFAEAQRSGRMAEEILPIEVPGKKGPVKFDKDDHNRPETTLESLAALKPSFKKDGTGTVTAGNASGMNDGAAAILMMTRKTANKLNLKPIASIGKHCNVGVDPAIMGIAPAFAIRKLMTMAGTTRDDYGLFEVNEAFAAQTLGVLRELGVGRKEMEAKFNVNGGAIAIGHPLAASGPRLIQTLIIEMRKRGVKKGIASLCCGGGTGIATEIILEN